MRDLLAQLLEQLSATKPETVVSNTVGYGLAIKDAVRISGLSRSQLYVYMQDGHLTYRQAGRRRLILLPELVEFLNSLPDGKNEINPPEHDQSPTARTDVTAPGRRPQHVTDRSAQPAPRLVQTRPPKKKPQPHRAE